MSNKKKNRRRHKSPLPTLVGCFLALAASIGLAVFLVTRKPQQGITLTEEILENGRVGLPATVCRPAGGKDWGLVVLCHGFTGNRRGDGHFEALQRTLAENGIASVAIDFPGCGDSAEEATAYTVAHMHSDITAAITALLQSEPISAERIGLLGHSMGGRVVSLYLAQGDYPVRAAALWSPANAAGLRGLGFLDANDFARVEQIAEEAVVNGSAQAGNFDFTVSDALVIEFSEAASDPDGALAAANIPLLLCFAGHETLFEADAVQATVDTVQNAGGEVLLDPFADANHNYASYDGDAARSAVLDETLRNATADFFIAQLAAR